MAKLVKLELIIPVVCTYVWSVITFLWILFDVRVLIFVLFVSVYTVMSYKEKMLKLTRLGMDFLLLKVR